MEEADPEPKRRDVARDRLEFDSTYHPGVDAKDLFHRVHGTEVSGHEADTSEPYRVSREGEVIICRNCGITDEDAHYGYTSRIKLFYLTSNNAIWELGGPEGQWLLRDELNIPDVGMTTDYNTQKLLRDANSGVPLVEMHRFEGKDRKFNFTMMSRAKGKTVVDLQRDGALCDEQLADILSDLDEVLQKARQFTSPYMERVGGEEHIDAFIGIVTELAVSRQDAMKKSGWKT